MRNVVVSVILLAVIFLSGCDGRAKILHLQPATSMDSPRTVSSVVIPMSGDEDIAGIVATVASDLGLSVEVENRWYTKTTYQNTFRLWVEKSEKGYWTVSLMDWPTTQRSQQSLKAEAITVQCPRSRLYTDHVHVISLRTRQGHRDLRRPEETMR